MVTASPEECEAGSLTRYSFISFQIKTQEEEDQ